MFARSAQRERARMRGGARTRVREFRSGYAIVSVARALAMHHSSS